MVAGRFSVTSPRLSVGRPRYTEDWRYQWKLIVDCLEAALLLLTRWQVVTGLQHRHVTLSASEWATTIFMQSQSHRKQSKPFFYQCWDWGHETIFNKNNKTGPKLSTCHFLMLTSYICSWHSGIFVWCPAHHSTPGHSIAQLCYLRAVGRRCRMLRWGRERAMSWVTSNWFLVFSLLTRERGEICSVRPSVDYTTLHSQLLSQTNHRHHHLLSLEKTFHVQPSVVFYRNRK